jgi:hypothetical protein
LGTRENEVESRRWEGVGAGNGAVEGRENEVGSRRREGVGGGNGAVEAREAPLRNM